MRLWKEHIDKDILTEKIKNITMINTAIEILNEVVMVNQR